MSEAAIMLLSVSGLQLVAVHLLGWPEPATITLQYIWDYLYSLYDIDALDEVEVVPFQLDEKEFKLREFFKVAKKSLKKEPTHTPERSIGTVCHVCTYACVHQSRIHLHLF